MDKSPDAFRTISEVADALETPAHVLRFWESRFPQIKPVKRAGGRRYYRPADVALLGGIRHLLHDEGMTIRGVQKILREQGVRHVAAMAPGGDLTAFDMAEEEDFALNLSASGEEAAAEPAEPETAQVLAMDTAPRREYTPPDAPAEVVQLRAPADLPDLSEGFMLPTANRRPLPTLDDPPADDVPEAGHVWVEDEEPEAGFAVPLIPVAGATGPLPDPGAPEPLQDEAFAPEGYEIESGETEPDSFAAFDSPASAELPTDPVEDVVPDLVAQAVQQSLFDEAEMALPDMGLPDLPLPDLPGVEESPELAAAMADAAPVSLAGIAARLRALPVPLSPEASAQVSELQMRLGLLHAQMVEAQRPRR